ncbi:MAG: hypothetical protein M5U19_08620 [Microthrixaceae bacterium]|nr:hypothetical protein [Microthrixaceae bacterium]
MARPRFRYSPRDGTQQGLEFDALDVLSELTDDLMYHGDVNAALRRMMQQGFQDRNGERIAGLREILEQIHDRRADTLERFDLGGVYDEISQELAEVVQAEREAIDQQHREDLASGDERRGELSRRSTDERHLELDMLPDDLAGKVKGLEAYDFCSPEAERRFAELTERLREQLMAQYVDRLTGAVEAMSPADMARMKDMMAALNEMLEQRARGEEPDFAAFMEAYGDFFGEDPQTLDELLEIMAQRMAAAQAMYNSMTPEQRAQMQQLSELLLEDMDLQWQAEQLGRNLRDAFPDAGWESEYAFEGADPLDMASAMQAMGELGDLDQMEQMLRGSPQPGALSEIDLERVRELVGDQPAASLERMAEITRLLTEAGLVEQTEGRLELTPAGLRRLGSNALAELFGSIDADRLGGHRRDDLGVGHERAYVTKPYEYGDPFNLDINRTIRNAVVRGEGLRCPCLRRTSRSSRPSRP